jgi:hypothetical protein
VADAMSGIVRPAYEFRSLRSATTLKVGMMRISTGSISVRKIVQKHAIRNGNRKYTMAYAEMMEIAILPIAIVRAMTRLFTSIRSTGALPAPRPPAERARA